MKNASATRREEGKRLKQTAEEARDVEIDAQVASDPDWAEIEPIDWSKAEIVAPPRKHAISIRLDEDLIGFFKAQGPGYQRRINAVLRAYMKERSGRAA